MNYQEALAERFLRYAAVASQSDENVGTVPSSPGQRKLALLLAEELIGLGLSDVWVSEHAVVIGRLDSNLPEDHAPVPTVGWVAHLDTVDVKLSPEVHPVTVRNYRGGDICQNAEKGLFIRAAEHPELAECLGQDLIVSDGTSVLGADNKAAIANIMTAIALVQSGEAPIAHGDIYVAFVPDEEIGLLGAKSMDLSRFPVDYAYTIDCCGLGEVVWETFNAGSAFVRFTGRTAHPMNSKGNLVNPCLAAVDFINLFDRNATPECTENKEGYIWVTDMTGDPLHATVRLNIRDHDRAGYEAKKAFIRDAVRRIRQENPKVEIEFTVEDVYNNIADAVTPENRGAIDDLYRAFEELGIVPKTVAMRGGTDGSYLSGQKILTPNYFTGARNFHSPAEFMPMGDVEKSLRVTLKLMELAAEQ